MNSALQLKCPSLAEFTALSLHLLDGLVDFFCRVETGNDDAYHLAANENLGIMSTALQVGNIVLGILHADSTGQDYGVGRLFGLCCLCCLGYLGYDIFFRFS